MQPVAVLDMHLVQQIITVAWKTTTRSRPSPEASILLDPVFQLHARLIDLSEQQAATTVSGRDPC